MRQNHEARVNEFKQKRPNFMLNQRGFGLTGTVIYHAWLSALPDAKRLEGISTLAIGLVVRSWSGGKRG